MATIEDEGHDNHEALKTHLKGLDEAGLLAQDLVQQGAIHAIGHLLKTGVTEANAQAMLASLRENARLVREEARSRGKEDLFSRDQTGFN
jgi:hypothetical protein